jgi:hypothetical protein
VAAARGGQRTFPISGGEEVEVPAEVQKDLDGAGPPVAEEEPAVQPLPAEDAAEGNDDKDDIESITVKSEASAEVGDKGEDGIAVPDEALAAGHPILPENKSKNQVEATPKEVAAGSHREADLKEFMSYLKNKAIGAKVEKVTGRIKRLIQTAAYRRTWKGDGNNRRAKSRLYVHGFIDPRDKGWLNTYSGTMEPGLKHLALLKALAMKWKAAKGDVETAFLKALSDAELYIKLPKDLPKEVIKLGYEPGGVYPQLKALYGRTDSPRLFTQAFKQTAAEFGWKEVDESILVHFEADGEIDGLLLMHMDDLLCLSEDPVAMLKELDTKMAMGDIELLETDVEAIYTGLDIKWDGPGGKCEIGQGRYIEAINTQLTDKDV